MTHNKSLLLLLFAALMIKTTAGLAKPPVVRVRVIEGGESKVPAADVRRMLVGPDVNQPDPHPGYAGFVGWESPLQLRDGTLLVGFSTGYWHASPPTPLRMPADLLTRWKEIGMPVDMDAPTGGRAMCIRSEDGGRTWSKPETMIDTPADDRHPNFVELDDGTILASFFTTPGQGDVFAEPDIARHVGLIRSTDGGRSWEQKPIRLPSSFASSATNGPPVVLADGSVVLSVYGYVDEGQPKRLGLFRSTDDGQSWMLQSIVRAEHELQEPSVAQLHDGRLVMIARPEGSIMWSDDRGETWTEPVNFGMRMYETGLLVLGDGTLLCLHGSYGGRGFRALFSTDGGLTWIAPADKYGFAVDAHTYGYGKGILLPDGSVYAVYIHTGGHRIRDARRNAIWDIRLRVRDDHSGIDVLPPPGSG